MQRFCHRCHGELPVFAPGSMQSSDDALLFCPRCSAPQILLPEHMRTEGDGGPSTTGTTPPPRPYAVDPRQIDWRVALASAGLVALAAAILRVLGLRFDFFAILWFFWMISGANVTLNTYARRRPLAWVNARVGFRIGIVTGILMLAAVSVSYGAAGVAKRYVLHDMAQSDEQAAIDAKVMQTKFQAWMQQQNIDPETRKNYALVVDSPMMNSPEMRAGSTLAGYGFAGLLLILVCAGVGALTGMLRGVRMAHQRREG